MNPTIPVPIPLKEYLLILSPPKELSCRIWSVKYEFADEFNAKLAAETGPHLTLINFVAPPLWEARIVSRLGLIGAGITPFDVELKDYDGFVNPRSCAIYIKVVSKDAVRNLAQELKQAKPLLQLNKAFQPHLVNVPHVSICRGLSSAQYGAAFPAYSGRHFYGCFTASSITLLKRPFGENGFTTAGIFPFESNPQLPTQGKLFM